MTGHACSSRPADGFAEEPEPFVGLHNWLLGDPKAYDRAWTVDLVAIARLHRGDAAAAARGARPRSRQPGAPEISCPAARRDRQARRHRCAAAWGQARPARFRPVLRHAVARQRQGRRALRAQPLLASPASFATAATTPPMRSTWRCSSTACRSRRSNSRTA